MAKSEFGKGLTYCLGLFLAHAERDRHIEPEEEERKRLYVEMWFNGAGDHLFELQYQYAPTPYLRNRLKRFRNKVLEWRFSMGKEKPVTEADRAWAIQEAKDLLRFLDDRAGVPVQKGDWE